MSFPRYDSRGLSYEIKQKIKKDQNHLCAKCRKKKTRLVIHHIIPVSEKGTNDRWNLIALCDYCHVKWHRIYKLNKTANFHKWLFAKPKRKVKKKGKK